MNCLFEIRLSALALFLLGVTGCSLSLPGEFGSIEKKIKLHAEHLLKERPQSSKTLISEGHQIHYLEVTDDESKPLVLFIHGSPGDWTAWAQYLDDPEFRGKAHMIAVDRPGFGGSETGQVERSVSQQVREMAPLLSKASPGKKVLVVGHSYGGPVAARLVMDYPNRVTDLLILAGSIDPAQEKDEWYQIMAEWPWLKPIIPRAITVANEEIMALKQSLTEMLPLWSNISQKVTVL
jgi:pimeloyl-ACP methyl ester carboxylesterase